MVEGIGAPTLRYDAICKLCKTTNGACTSCLQCHATFHVGCAHNSGYIFGFDMTPVKASRRDAVPTVTMNGETGTLLAAIWCKDHAPKTIVHPMNEEVEGSDLVALQLFAREFKQADLTLTGTARKAALVDQSTRTVPQAAPLQVNRRASAVTASTPTSARGRHSIVGMPTKEESSEPPPARDERKCVQCKIDASPKWYPDTAVSQHQRLRVVDGPLASNGPETNGHSEDKPAIENKQTVNGTVDHTMTDVPPHRSPVTQAHPRLDTNVTASQPVSYMCLKCFWKREHGIADEEERPRAVSMLPEPQLLPLRSPIAPSYVAPTPPGAMTGSWPMPGGHASMSMNQPPPLPSWHSPAPPGPPGHLPPHHLHNGNGYPPGLPGPPLGHAFHPYAPPNGYTPYPGPPMHPQMSAAPLRSAYPGPSVSGPPPPLHLSNGTVVVNGMQSPHTIPYSPTLAHAHHAARSTESPFTASLPAVAQYSTSLHHASVAPGLSSTPRDAVMRDAPTSMTMERANTGASASPSLRNLLH